MAADGRARTRGRPRARSPTYLACARRRPWRPRPRKRPSSRPRTCRPRGSTTTTVWWTTSSELLAKRAKRGEKRRRANDWSIGKQLERPTAVSRACKQAFAPKKRSGVAVTGAIRRAASVVLMRSLRDSSRWRAGATRLGHVQVEPPRTDAAAPVEQKHGTLRSVRSRASRQLRAKEAGPGAVRQNRVEYYVSKFDPTSRMLQYFAFSRGGRSRFRPGAFPGDAGSFLVLRRSRMQPHMSDTGSTTTTCARAPVFAEPGWFDVTSGRHRLRRRLELGKRGTGGGASRLHHHLLFLLRVALVCPVSIIERDKRTAAARTASAWRAAGLEPPVGPRPLKPSRPTLRTSDWWSTLTRVFSRGDATAAEPPVWRRLAASRSAPSIVTRGGRVDGVCGG